MYNTLIDINTDGNILLHDDSVALMPKLFAVYKDKHFGSKMVKYIVSVADYKSPFRNLPEDERKSRAAYSVYGKDKAPRASDRKVLEALEEYRLLQYDPLVDQYRAMGEQMYKMNKVFKAIEPTAKNLDELNDIQKKMGVAAESREKIKILILKDQESETNIKGTDSSEFSFFEEEQILSKK
jgi:hypothetical protein